VFNGFGRFQDFGRFGGRGGGGGGGGPTVPPLTLGTATLNDLARLGDVVAPILTPAGGSVVTMFGDAFDQGFLDVIGSNVVAGASVPVAGDNTGTFYLREQPLIGGPVVSGPFTGITVTRRIKTFDNNGGYNRSADAQLEANTAADMVMGAILVRLDAVPGVATTMFHVFRSGALVHTRLRVNSSAQAWLDFDNTQTVLDLGTLKINRWQLILFRFCRSNVHTDRRRSWVYDFDSGVLPGAGIATGTNLPTPQANFLNAFNGVEIFASGTTALQGRLAFAWIHTAMASPTTPPAGATIPAIDLGTAANIAAFDPRTINTTNGTVTLMDGVNPITITPKLFLTANSAGELNAAAPDGLVNRGTWAVEVPKVGGNDWTESDWVSEIPLAGNPAVVARSSVESNGVTFTFGATRDTWQYADESYGVDSAGSMTITAISPASVQAVRPILGGGNTASLWHHGAMIDPGNAVRYGAFPYVSGFEQGLEGYRDPNDIAPPYRHSLNADPAATGAPITITEGSILKRISVASVPLNGQNMAARNVILTVTNGKPPTPAPDLYFRPPYQPAVKNLWIKTNDFSFAGWPSLSSAGVSNIPSIGATYSKLRELTMNWAVNRRAHIINVDGVRDTGYGGGKGGIAQYTGDAVLLMCMASTSAQDRQMLAEAVTTIGMDMCGIVEQGIKFSASGGGGTSVGRKLALCVAAKLTGNARLLAAAGNTEVLPEDQQIWTVDLDLINNYGYPMSLLGRGEWSSQTRAGVADLGHTDRPGYPWNVAYRHLWGAIMYGHYVALRAIPGLEAIWNNPAFGDYMTRYWQVESTAPPVPSPPNPPGALGNFQGDPSTSLSAGPGVFYRTLRQTNPGLF
jgi:hypothetical protein